MESRTVSYLNRDCFEYCMHACGLIHDLMFTNSMEAMGYWYEHGIRLFEVDIDCTEDGEYVACHNFNKETFIKMEIEDIPLNCTYEWFRKQKLYTKSTKGLTPMTFENLFEQLKEHSDMVVMVDPKIYSYEGIHILLDKMRYYISEFVVSKDRIIFETYNEDMIRAARHYTNIVQLQYCVDDEMQMGTSQRMRAWDIDFLITFLKKNDTHIVSYPWKLAVENLINLKKLHDAEFIIFSKTRNDILANLLKQSGVNVNIIDYLVTDTQRKALQGYKGKYFEMYKDKIDEVFGGRT